MREELENGKGRYRLPRTALPDETDGLPSPDGERNSPYGFDFTPLTVEGDVKVPHLEKRVVHRPDYALIPGDRTAFISPTARSKPTKMACATRAWPMDISSIDSLAAILAVLM